MPYIPILFGWPDWLYAIVGVAITGLLWWRRDWWIKAVVSLVIFVGVAYPFQFAGMHKCYEGRPPNVLEYAFGIIAALLPWCFGNWKWPVPVGFVAVLFLGTFTARSLAHSYHCTNVTGNPGFSSGRFWHSPISGQYPRDQEKYRAFQESLR